MTQLLVVFTLLCNVFAFAGGVSQKKSRRCANAMTQREMNACSMEYFKKADAELNRVYQRLLSRISASERANDRANLLEAQRAWLKYRDTNCKAEHDLYLGGSMAPMVESACLESVTLARTKELLRMYAER